MNFSLFYDDNAYHWHYNILKCMDNSSVYFAYLKLSKFRCKTGKTNVQMKI